jgi:hypothetical protein
MEELDITVEEEVMFCWGQQNYLLAGAVVVRAVAVAAVAAKPQVLAVLQTDLTREREVRAERVAMAVTVVSAIAEAELMDLPAVAVHPAMQLHMGLEL